MDILGCLALILSALFNGSAFVPVKFASGDVPRFEHAIFQGWWGVGAAISMIFSAPFNCLIDDSKCGEFSLLGLGAGGCVFAATIFVLVAVQHLGVGIQPSLVAACFCLASLFNGLVFLDETAEPPEATSGGVALLLLGAAGVAACHALSANYISPRRGAGLPGDATQLLPPKGAPPTNLPLGVLTSVLTGVIGALVPYMAQKAKDLDGNAVSPFGFTASVGVGLFAVTLMATPLRVCLARKMQRSRSGEAHLMSQVGLLAPYGILSGGLWGAGNALINFGLQRGISHGVASCIYQCGLLVGGLWGIGMGEIRGRRAIVCFMGSAASLIFGIVLLAFYVKPSS